MGREEGGEGREGSETGGAWVGTGLGREDGGERDGRCIVHGMGVDACAADMLVTRTSIIAGCSGSVHK